MASRRGRRKEHAVMTTKAFDHAIELATGEPIESIRNTPVDERRNAIEEKRGRKIRLTTRFPFIGRGNVLHDRLVDHEQAERALREALDE